MRNRPRLIVLLIMVVVFALPLARCFRPAYAASRPTDDRSAYQSERRIATPAAPIVKDDLNVPAVWIQGIVDADGQGEALAIDAAGRVGISYASLLGEEPGVRVASREEDSWRYSTIPYPSLSLGAATALAFDLQGNTHLAFVQYHMLSQQVYYATSAANETWTAPTLLDPALASPNSIAVAVGSDGYARVTYCTQNRLTLATQLWYVEMSPDGSIWIKSPLGKEGCWFATSLAIDDSGIPHIVYHSRPDGGEQGVLKYAKWVDGVWQFSTVDDSGDAGRHLSLAVTPDGTPYIAYTFVSSSGEQRNHEVRYASLDGETWHIETLAEMAPSDQTAGGVSIALDASGRPSLAYLDAPSQTIRYAWYENATWQEMSVTAIQGVRLGSRALALDYAGVPHLAYSVPAGVRYAYLSSEMQIYFPLLY